MANKYTVAIDDLAVEGPELSDEQLLAVRGGGGKPAPAMRRSTCVADGYDYD